MTGVRIPSDLKRLSPLPSARTEAQEADLCPGCKFGVMVSFRSRRPEWSCVRGIFTLSERRLSGPVTQCGAFEKQER